MNYGSPSPAARSLADMVIGHVDRQSPHIDDSARADALALAFVDVAERVYPGGLAKGCTTGVDFEREGVMVRVVALEVPVSDRDIKPESAALSYGSDNAGGVYLHLGDARIHLSGDAVHDLAAGLMAEATRPTDGAR